MIGKKIQTWVVGIVFKLISRIRINLLPELNECLSLFDVCASLCLYDGTCVEDRIKAMLQNYLDRHLYACFLVLKNSTEEDPNLALD